jgi:hypothetical protein
VGGYAQLFLLAYDSYSGSFIVAFPYIHVHNLNVKANHIPHLAGEGLQPICIFIPDQEGKSLNFSVFSVG